VSNTAKKSEFDTSLAKNIIFFAKNLKIFKVSSRKGVYIKTIKGK